jgi:hypothetical protein
MTVERDWCFNSRRWLRLCILIIPSMNSVYVHFRQGRFEIINPTDWSLRESEVKNIPICQKTTYNLTREIRSGRECSPPNPHTRRKGKKNWFLLSFLWDRHTCPYSRDFWKHESILYESVGKITHLLRKYYIIIIIIIITIVEIIIITSNTDNTAVIMENFV